MEGRTAGRARASSSFNTCISGVQRPAATHVGKSPDCRKLGLGVQEISIAAGTGTDRHDGRRAGAPAPGVRHQAPGYPELYLDMSVKTGVLGDWAKTPLPRPSCMYADQT